MKGEKLTLEELYAIKTAGGRNSGEKSNALPSSPGSNYYGDPSKVVEFPAERERRLKRAKKSKNRNRGNR
jgi:hypothetical protein